MDKSPPGGLAGLSRRPGRFGLAFRSWSAGSAGLDCTGEFALNSMYKYYLYGEFLGGRASCISGPVKWENEYIHRERLPPVS